MAKKVYKPTDTNTINSVAFNWNSFVHDVVNGKYILVLGSEIMLSKDTNKECNGDSSTLVLNDVKEALIAEGNLSKEKQLENFSHLACSHSNIDNHIRESVNQRLEFLVDEMEPLLVELIKTKHFRVVLTTTFDPYINELMESVWGKGNVRIMSIYNKVQDGNFDFPEYVHDDITNPVQPTVYYIFGKAFNIEEKPRFVVSDNDAIEVISKWMGKGAPEKFLEYIRSKRMLALGCEFDDWFFRFFWYSLHGSVNNLTKGEVAISYNPCSEIDKKLKSYLDGQRIFFSPDARLFLKEAMLHFNEYDAFEQVINKRQEGEIFLSYAFEDADIVKKLFFRLQESGLKVWLDNRELKGADDYEKKIPVAISRCRVFMPILSGQTQKDIAENNWRYYKDVEWVTAQQEYNSNPDRIIVLPVRLLGYDTRNFTNKAALPSCMQKTVFDMAISSSDELVTRINELIK